MKLEVSGEGKSFRHGGCRPQGGAAAVPVVNDTLFFKKKNNETILLPLLFSNLETIFKENQMRSIDLDFLKFENFPFYLL